MYLWCIEVIVECSCCCFALDIGTLCVVPMQSWCIVSVCYNCSKGCLEPFKWYQFRGQSKGRMTYCCPLCFAMLKHLDGSCSVLVSYVLSSCPHCDILQATITLWFMLPKVLNECSHLCLIPNCFLLQHQCSHEKDYELGIDNSNS